MAEKQTEQKNAKNPFLHFSRFVLGAFFAFLLIVVFYAFSNPLRDFLRDELKDNQPSDVSDDTQKTDGKNDNPAKMGPSEQTEDAGIYPYQSLELLTDVEKDETIVITDETLHAEHIALLRVEDMTLLASKDAEERIHPASMTKVMTLLVATDHIVSLDEEVPVKGELFDQYADLLKGTEQFITYQYEKGDNMTVPVKTLLYLIGMESAADATLMLTDYLAGSPDEFVNWMNQKAKQLKLRDTHFTNAIGIYDENLYSTAVDMAVIMANAMQIDVLVDVLGTAEAKSPAVYNGKTINFWPKHTLFYDFYTKNTSFSRKLANGFYVTAAKTGTEDYKVSKKQTIYIKALVSMTTDKQNGQYVLVTVSESSSATVLKDLVSDLETVFQGTTNYILQ